MKLDGIHVVYLCMSLTIRINKMLDIKNLQPLYIFTVILFVLNPQLKEVLLFSVRKRYRDYIKMLHS